jgi:cyclophilin family peptidyl-prolyl cis-trans isomerase
MVQGGDPTGTGEGGESATGEFFAVSIRLIDFFNLILLKI